MKCIVEGCDRIRAKDSLKCADHRWADWSLRKPEWRRRAEEATRTRGFVAVKEVAA